MSEVRELYRKKLAHRSVIRYNTCGVFSKILTIRGTYAVYQEAEMITKIGLVAGDIWNYFDKHNGAGNLNDIISGVGKEKDLVLMSIGWLAREGHVVLTSGGSEYIVKLANKVQRH